MTSDILRRARYVLALFDRFEATDDAVVVAAAGEEVRQQLILLIEDIEKESKADE